MIADWQLAIVMRYGNRITFGLSLLTLLFLAAALLAILLYSLAPATAVARGPLLVIAFVAILLGSLICILFLGIADSNLHRIFIPFFTTKEKGHGIGLALAHRVITEHGGTLTAASTKEGGARFTVRLPA